MTTKIYAAIDDAMEAFSTPEENRPLIRRIADELKLARFSLTSGYIKAERADGGPLLRIASGWSNGFLSKEEAMQFVSEDEIGACYEREALFSISLPKNSLRAGNGSTSQDRDYGICPDCNF